MSFLKTAAAVSLLCLSFSLQSQACDEHEDKSASIDRVLATSAAPVAPAAGMKTASFKIKEMHCTSCEKSMRGEWSKLPGVQSMEFQVEKKTARVTYDPQKITPEALIKAVAARGYTATELPN